MHQLPSTKSVLTVLLLPFAWSEVYLTIQLGWWPIALPLLPPTLAMTLGMTMWWAEFAASKACATKAHLAKLRRPRRRKRPPGLTPPGVLPPFFPSVLAPDPGAALLLPYPLLPSLLCPTQR